MNNRGRLGKTLGWSIFAVLGFCTGYLMKRKEILKLESKLNSANETSNKNLILYRTMEEWLSLKQKNKEIVQFFEKNNFKEIAVYGMSYAGKDLIKELKNTGVIVLYGIDKNRMPAYEGVQILTPDDNLEKVDAVIVTAIAYFEEITIMLSKKIESPIISLEEVLCDSF